MCDISDAQKLQYIENLIAEYPDYPKPGIIFRDIFSALTDPQACLYLKNLLLSHIQKHYPDVEMIVGLESRGFLFNMILATELGIGCAPIRKKGKLPGECISVSYDLEYGSDVFEMQTKSLKIGQKVIIVDDLLATGGTMSAAVELVRKTGGIVVESLVIMELIDLKGRAKLDCPVHSLIKY